MEKISINLNSKVSALKTLNVQNMMIVDGRLRIHLIDDGAKSINEGDSIIVTRYFKDSSLKEINRNVTVIKKLDDSNIIVSQPERTDTYRVVINENSYTESWPLDVTMTFDRRLDLYSSDVAEAKRHTTLNPIAVTFTNSSRPLETVTKYYPTVVDDITNFALTFNFTEEEFEIVNSDETTITISTNEFYDVDYNGYCHQWDEYEDDIAISYSIDNRYYKVPIFVGNHVDHIGLNAESSLSTLYEEEYKNSLIPEIIDMEKVKFNPMVISGDTLIDCGSMNFKFHFRSRKTGDTSWSVDQKAPYPWNQGISEENMDTKATEIAQSDLLGCLDFEDADIANQKMKLKQSFIRLLFYSSKDMAEQKLLFYSTVFFDSTGIHNKYINLVNSLSGYTGSFVNYSGGSYEDRLTSEITITNSYDNTRSSEGFYLYLFKTDDFTPDYENTEKTIYMKVEFNHAKFGRTIPMLVWPTDSNGNGQYVTTANYFDCLYIPVNLKLMDGKYVYSFPEKVKNTINNGETKLTFTLFEPRLVMQKDKSIWKS